MYTSRDGNILKCRLDIQFNQKTLFVRNKFHTKSDLYENNKCIIQLFLYFMFFFNYRRSIGSYG